MIMEPEFSDESAAAVRRAGERLQEALGTQIELAARARQDTDLAELDEAAEAVRELLADYAQALLDHCGEPAPFEDSVEEPEPESDDDGSTLISRLTRTDFMIVDEPALLADGARAGAESGSAPPPVLDPVPMSVSRAIRLIVSARGPDGLWRAAGVRPLWSEMIILRPDPVEIDDEDEADDEEFDDPLSIFDIDGEIVSTESEQFFR
ncbi:hypothetical protein [Microlunatus parietis]|uniref:Uncharacterized protein n=1 Tax=Microlunatus parietis TaxID=682979 RepID=A0A7Y9LF63_9ACTN|nr:hypothetical protein [Microlunatus parietis]NYE74625.1 hypothetical protein [Microlunatus parietis]